MFKIGVWWLLGNIGVCQVHLSCKEKDTCLRLSMYTTCREKPTHFQSKQHACIYLHIFRANAILQSSSLFGFFFFPVPTTSFETLNFGDSEQTISRNFIQSNFKHLLPYIPRSLLIFYFLKNNPSLNKNTSKRVLDNKSQSYKNRDKKRYKRQT